MTRIAVHCDGARLRGRRSGQVVAVDLWGSNPTGRVQIENIEQAIIGNLAPRFRDLLEIAAYVYLADTETSRGGGDGRLQRALAP